MGSSQIVTNKNVQIPVPATPPNVFEFQDYRAYLKAVLSARQRAEKGYNMVRFAKSLGFSSHSGLAMVLSGQRELKDPYLSRCTKNLRLTFKEKLYFEAMVRAGKMSPDKRRGLLREMEFYTGHWELPEANDGIRMLDFGVVQQVLAMHRGYISIEKILGFFRYEISVKDVKRILDWMREKNYVEVTPEGYRINKSVLLVPDEIPNASGKQLHRDCLNLAAFSLAEDPLERREFQTYLLTVDSKRIPEMKQKIKKMVLDAISEFETELDADTVVQVHFNMFEMTKREEGKNETNH